MKAKTEKREKPILFSGPMVRALLEGRKTMTRRTRGLERVNERPDTFKFLGLAGGYSSLDTLVCHQALFHDEKLGGNVYARLPYRIGDRLWVRETWCDADNEGIGDGCGGTAYRADYPSECLELKGGWRPSIHMPRDRSRLLRDVASFRIERLQDITDADALDEGACLPDHAAKPGCYRAAFEGVWTAINGADSWALNPWVAVYGLRETREASHGIPLAAP